MKQEAKKLEKPDASDRLRQSLTWTKEPIKTNIHPPYSDAWYNFEKQRVNKAGRIANTAPSPPPVPGQNPLLPDVDKIVYAYAVLEERRGWSLLEIRLRGTEVLSRKYLDSPNMKTFTIRKLMRILTKL